MKWLTVLVLVCAVLAGCDDNNNNTPSDSGPGFDQNSRPNLPDLVILDITLRKTNDPEFVIINTVVRNNGASSGAGFIVGCQFACSNSMTYFSGMKVENGLSSNQEVTLGGNAELHLGGCSFTDRREFTCTVDADGLVNEINENNNTLTETLLTGR